MLVNLHVKDLALIKEIDINFGEGLNIITGETGAGKSIIIGSVNIALGDKVSREMIREDAEYGFVELVFSVDRQELRDALAELDIPSTDEQIILSRKIMSGHSISKINGTTVTLTALRQIASSLVDIYGQNDHQSLLHKSKHLEILDEFAADKISDIRSKVFRQYKEVRAILGELEKYNMDEELRLREISFLQYEIEEIENAGLKPGEDLELEIEYQKMANARKIHEVLGRLCDSSLKDDMGSLIKELGGITEYDSKIKGFYDQLLDIEYTYEDYLREVRHYTQGVVYDEQYRADMQKRLDLLNKLKSKYGNSLESILNHKEESLKKLEELMGFENMKKTLQGRLERGRAELHDRALQLSAARKKNAAALEKRIIEALKDLNFREVQFSIQFATLNEVGEKGIDSVEFLISTNPGETPKSLNKIASGGELSRIMLAIKTILASKDNIDTLIFDEIDTGISGRTAQKVSEKLSVLGKKHQVLCITHLAQIAAMADNHFMIEKKLVENHTVTEIKRLDEREMIEELSRILGGLKITDTVRNNALEMKEQAKKLKN